MMRRLLLICVFFNFDLCKKKRGTKKPKQLLLYSYTKRICGDARQRSWVQFRNTEIHWVLKESSFILWCCDVRILDFKRQIKRTARKSCSKMFNLCFFFAWRLEVQYFFTSFCKHRQGQNKPGVCWFFLKFKSWNVSSWKPGLQVETAHLSVLQLSLGRNIGRNTQSHWNWCW